jgi:hypothetical protein
VVGEEGSRSIGDQRTTVRRGPGPPAAEKPSMRRRGVGAPTVGKTIDEEGSRSTNGRRTTGEEESRSTAAATPFSSRDTTPVSLTRLLRQAPTAGSTVPSGSYRKLYSDAGIGVRDWVRKEARFVHARGAPNADSLTNFNRPALLQGQFEKRNVFCFFWTRQMIFVVDS